MTDPDEDTDPQDLSWARSFKWSLIMLAISLLVAAISIPLLRLFGVEWGD